MEPFISLQDRYFSDPKFASLVDQMVSMMTISHFTGYEIRDAAFMASIKFSQTHVEPMFIRGRFPEDANGLIQSIGVKP